MRWNCGMCDSESDSFVHTLWVNAKRGCEQKVWCKYWKCVWVWREALSDGWVCLCVGPGQHLHQVVVCCLRNISVGYLLRKLLGLPQGRVFLFSGMVNVRRRCLSHPPGLRQGVGWPAPLWVVTNITFQCCHEAQHFYPTGNLAPLCSWRNTFNHFLRVSWSCLLQND